jgi:hypothetical protein
VATVPPQGLGTPKTNTCQTDSLDARDADPSASWNFPKLAPGFSGRQSLRTVGGGLGVWPPSAGVTCVQRKSSRPSPEPLLKLRACDGQAHPLPGFLIPDGRSGVGPIRPTLRAHARGYGQSCAGDAYGFTAPATIAAMPARRGSGRWSQARTTAAKSGRSRSKCAKQSAKTFADGAEVPVFPVDSAHIGRFCKPQVVGSNPTGGFLKWRGLSRPCFRRDAQKDLSEAPTRHDSPVSCRPHGGDSLDSHPGCPE